MIERSSRRVLVAVCLAVLCTFSASTASAQITTGTVLGNVKDSSGAVVPGATVVLVSETKGTKSLPAISNASGDYVFPNVTPDTYAVEITMDGFRTVKRGGIRVSGGDRVSVTALTLEPGGAAETVNVTSEAPLIQASSGERSFAVSTTQIENLPINHGNFTSVTSFVPGVVAGGASAGGTRLGGVSQNNIMMDGISAMDTGNNGQMINMNIESIAEVKVLTQGYQAEYGRSSGLQITAVTKSGTNRFRGSAYDLKINSDWNENSWVNQKNGDPKPVDKRDIYGYTVGGPVGKPGGNNKLFFFYAHEYRPTNSAINGGNPIRLRLPTAAERAGDFSQTRDNNGNLFNLIRDYTTNLPCSATDTRGCFQDGGVLGKIPQNRLYQAGVDLLKRYPAPNVEQAAGANYNYQVDPPSVKNNTQQPAIRIDYQLSSKLRVTGKYSGERQKRLTTPGLIQGFTDVNNPNPFITNYAITANYAITPTTFLEGTWGMIRNELVGGNEGGVLVNDSSNRLTSMPNLPIIYPGAGAVDPRYYANEVLGQVSPPFWDGKNLNLPPIFAWGSRIQPAGTNVAPPNQRYPGWLNINRTNDVAISLTKVAGRHTFKGGFYNNHSFKAQNVGAGGGLSFQGNINFGNDTNNPLDTGFGYANAALGIFSQYTQADKFIEGQMVYNQTEGYIQDNWKATNRLTLDYGVRLTHQQPQYDKFQQMSNFFPDQWSLSQAPVLYVPGCSNGVYPCTGNNRNAMDPRTGQFVALPAGVPNSQVLIGTPIPGSGNALNGIKKAGDGIAKTGYTWPALVVGPRFGAAYDVSGTQRFILRGGVGLFYDRPDGNTVFSIPGNPPIASSADLRYSQLSTLGQGLAPGAVPQLVTFQYDAKVPGSWQWQGGIQMALPWAASLDVSYVGNHGFDRMGNLQGGGTVNLNAVDIGAAYLPANQDPTLAASATPAASAYTTNLLKPFRGLANINQNTTSFWDTYHSLQFAFNRRFQNGFSAGANYNLGLSWKGNTGLVQRLQHAPDGTISLRADQAQYEDMFSDLGLQRHVFKANAVWDMPDMAASSGSKKVVGYIVNDWQLSGVYTANTGTPYDLAFQYNANGGNVNLTGSPDYGARVVINGDAGSGCSDNQYAQFSTAVVHGPTDHSVGLDSGRNLFRNCATNILDLSLVRNIRLGGGRLFQFRVDAFNALNTVIYSNRNARLDMDNPVAQNQVNNQFLADGSLNPARLTPRNAGFGAATAAQNMRNFQMYIRFQF
jgi:Carboxypeptidase regulatory-like domain/TonB-dependent Receptor Plug Domain